VLYLVPLARPRREMTHRDTESRLVSQALQRNFPQPNSRAVASAAIGGY
jgi:hypothetical protein